MALGAVIERWSTISMVDSIFYSSVDETTALVETDMDYLHNSKSCQGRRIAWWLMLQFFLVYFGEGTSVDLLRLCCTAFADESLAMRWYERKDDWCYVQYYANFHDCYFRAV